MEDVPVRHVQTAKIRYRPDTDQYRVSLTDAIRAAGLGADAMFRYLPEEVDELGLVPALGADDGKLPNDDRTYSVVGTGPTGETLRLQMPEDALDALGIDTDPETAQAGELPLLDVYAGDRMIAFDKSSARAIPADQLPADCDVNDKSEEGEVILEQIQTTTPRLQVEGVVSAAVRPALMRAGTEAGAVEFLPELTDQDNGFVVAVTRESGDARSGGDARAIYRTADGEGFYVGLPDETLAALGLSVEEYEDVPLAERPALSVYASDGVIGFARLGERDITVDREGTLAEAATAPSLTDVDGIGSALADRLSAAGYETIEDLADATREDLLAIDNLGERRARRIMADVADRMNKRDEDR
jgi:hypothetical protein